MRAPARSALTLGRPGSVERIGSASPSAPLSFLRASA